MLLASNVLPQFHPGLLRSSAIFLAIATTASWNNVVSSISAALNDWNYVFLLQWRIDLEPTFTTIGTGIIPFCFNLFPFGISQRCRQKPFSCLAPMLFLSVFILVICVPRSVVLLALIVMTISVTFHLSAFFVRVLANPISTSEFNFFFVGSCIFQRTVAALLRITFSLPPISTSTNFALRIDTARFCFVATEIFRRGRVTIAAFGAAFCGMIAHSCAPWGIDGRWGLQSRDWPLFSPIITEGVQFAIRAI